MEYQIILGVVSAILALVGYVAYFREIFFGNTKPHGFSWLIWGILNTLVFFASTSQGGGAGAWVVGISAVLNFVIFGVALFRGEEEITRIDKMCLIAAFLGITFWALTSDPAWSIVIISIVDLVGFIPTFRKAYKRPWEESITIFALSDVSFAISLFALQAVNVTTFLYPATLVVANTVFVAMVLYRRNGKAKPRRQSHRNPSAQAPENSVGE